MDENPEILSFVKALASADRLRIVGVLARGKASQSDIAEQLHLPIRDEELPQCRWHAQANPAAGKQTSHYPEFHRRCVCL